MLCRLGTRCPAERLPAVRGVRGSQNLQPETKRFLLRNAVLKAIESIGRNGLNGVCNLQPQRVEALQVAGHALL